MVTYDEQFLILDEESSHSQITKSYRLIGNLTFKPQIIRFKD